MQTATTPTTRPKANHLLTREDLLTLAKFCDERANAVSFCFSLASTPDNAHRREVTAIKRLAQDVSANFAPESAPTCLTKDLAGILGIAEEIRLNPARLRVVFACGEQHFWQEFDLPFPGSLSYLRIGRCFYLAPLMLAWQSVAPYCVAVLESGKARAFVVRGTEIQEVSGRLAIEESSLQANDPRVGWSSHVSKSQMEHERAYFKKLAHQLLQLMLEQQATGLVIGCHDDLWGEVEPQFIHLEKVLMGRFQLPHFDAGPAEVLRMATPACAENQRKRSAAVLLEINEKPYRGALGVSEVLQALIGGRAQKLVLGKLPNQTISECGACGRMLAGAGQNCVCGNSRMRYMSADEGLIRKALLTDAEVFLVATETVPGFGGAAALLRY
jgi:peptide subunit release factor 1 (eRF1)